MRRIELDEPRGPEEPGGPGPAVSGPRGPGGSGGRSGGARLEIAAVGLFFASWLLAALASLGFVDLAGALPLSFYTLYSTAAALGWVAGNVYVIRRRGVRGRPRRRMGMIYWLGPPGIVYLLRAMAPAADQLAAPLVPLYALGVYSVLFTVPVLLRRTSPPAPPVLRG